MSATTDATKAASASEEKVDRRVSLSKEKTDALNSFIKGRTNQPFKGQDHIMPGGSDRFAANRIRLQHELVKNTLARGIDARPEVEDLVENNIIEDIPVAPRLQAIAKKLERNMTSDLLGKQLYGREDIETLKSHGLLPASDVAPAIRAKKIALDYAMKRDNVAYYVESRPDAATLVKAGILHPTNLSARLQSVQKQLQHNIISDKVSHLLEKRADPQELLQHGLLHDVRVAPRLQGVQAQLQKKLAKANLFHALEYEKRPTLDDLADKGIYHPEQDERFEWRQEAEDLAQRLHEQKQQFAQLQYQHQQQQQQFQDEKNDRYESTGYQRRSRNFHLTRILLKTVAQMAEVGEISLSQKGYLKDLIVDQDGTILVIAECYDVDNNFAEFKDSLVRIASRRSQ